MVKNNLNQKRKIASKENTVKLKDFVIIEIYDEINESTSDLVFKKIFEVIERKYHGPIVVLIDTEGRKIECGL